MTEQHHGHILKERFGLAEFRRGQKEIIQSVLDGRDVMAVLPTGGGKSLCYQFPAVIKNDLVIVISPLIALMKDQVAGLKKRGIAAGCLHSGQDITEKRQVFQNMAGGGAFLLYLSPERAQKDGFQRWLNGRKISLFAIDESHCVSQWGHDFRPEYAQLNLLKTLRPDVPMLALTASATPRVLADISRHLGLTNPARHVHGFYRPNLYYQVETCPDQAAKLAFVRQALRQNPSGRVIIYCGTRKLTEEVAATISGEFPGCASYHAGMPPEERHRVQAEYTNGHLRILTATNAFGMGVDHPDVRLVAHFNMPANIDTLYQEMGRAGRDGRNSTCLLLFAGKDKSLQSYFIQSSEAPSEIKRSRWNTLNALLDYIESGECRHAGILTYYRDSQRFKRCGHCDVCDPGSARKISRPDISLMYAAAPAKPKKAPKSARNDALLDEVEQMRFQLLREWRLEKADELDVPAFVVFSDRSLKHAARVNPATFADLEKIYGFGKVKIDRFGREILAVLGRG